MSEISIRPARLSDVPILLSFEQGVINAERPFDSTLKRTETHYYNLEELILSEHIEIVVAEVNHEVIGSGYIRIQQAKPYLIHEEFGYLGFMYVHPDFRGRGINQMILNALVHWGTQKNIHEFRLEVYVDNLSAVKAYEKAGFKGNLLVMRLNTN